MRQRLVFGAVLCSPVFLCSVASLLACLALGACGGSASETPPPLQPDPKGFHYASPPLTASNADSDAGAPLPASSDPDEEPKPRAPARSTWGSKPGH